MDLRKLKEQASRLVVEGRYERAEVLYRQLLTVAPRDSGLWLKHADLLKRLERVQPAASSYRMAAQLLMEQGHTSRAVACLKVALTMMPGDVELVSDIIRFELRARQSERAPAPATERAVAPEAPHATDAHTEPEPEPARLALPMFTSTESTLASMVKSVSELPPPRASVPRVPIEVEVPLQAWPQVRRVSDNEVAIKASPLSPWIVVTAAAPIEVKFFDEFPVAEEAVWLEAPSS